jgi:hypothetical protein
MFRNIEPKQTNEVSTSQSTAFSSPLDGRAKEEEEGGTRGQEEEKHTLRKSAVKEPEVFHSLL